MGIACFTSLGVVVFGGEILIQPLLLIGYSVWYVDFCGL